MCARSGRTPPHNKRPGTPALLSLLLILNWFPCWLYHLGTHSTFRNPLGLRKNGRGKLFIEVQHGGVQLRTVLLCYEFHREVEPFIEGWITRLGCGVWI